MTDYSIELTSERIYDSRTKKYFEEVIKGYAHGNYRSATVMLWTVVICDLLYKLQHLKEINEDKVAGDILNEIEKKQENDRKQSEWETYLVEEVNKRTSLLELPDYENILTLKTHRNLSAHPSLKSDDVLYEPHREMVRSDIRSMLEGILIKPPILSKKITDELLNNLCTVKEMFPEDQKLKRYLDAKYFNKLNNDVESAIFKVLWKLIFRLSNGDCENNREITYRAFKILCERMSKIEEIINHSKDYYSNISPEITNKRLYSYLIEFLFDYPKVYSNLNSSAQELIKCAIDEYNIFKLLSIFLYETPDDFIQSTLAFIEGSNISMDLSDTEIKIYLNKFKESCNSVEKSEMFKKSCLINYSKSPDYDYADRAYRVFIRPILNELTEEELKLLLELSNTNNQTYTRGLFVHTEYKEIKKRCDETLGKDYDYSQLNDDFREILLGSE